MMQSMALFCLACCSVSIVLGVGQLFWTLRKRRTTRPLLAHPPWISVLKPLKGLDDGLEENLSTLFTQDYPHYELLFGVEGEEDPAIGAVHRVAARYPHTPYRLVIHEGGRGFNPKVSNIRRILETGSHDLLVINDSNIAVPSDYLWQMVSPLLQEAKVGLVTSFFVGKDERTLWALLENMYINGPLATMLSAYQALMQEALVIGKSNAFRRSFLESLGGLESLAYLQAEDYHMGKMVKRAGYEVRFATTLCYNRNLHTRLSGLWQRYIRWGIARTRLTPLLYPLEALLNPFLVASGVVLALDWWWALGWWLVLSMSRDALQWLRFRGRERLLWVLFCVPLRDILFAMIWLAAPFYRTINWRGHRLIVGAGTHLFLSTPPQEARAKEQTQTRSLSGSTQL